MQCARYSAIECCQSISFSIIFSAKQMKFSIQPRAMMKYMRRHACWLTHQPIQLNKWWWHKRANKWMRIESETKLARISMEINSYCHYRYYFYQSSNHITRTFTHITVLILLYNFMIIHDDYVLIIANKFWFCAACATSTTITTLLHFVYIGIACATAKIELFVAVVWVCVFLYLFWFCVIIFIKLNAVRM